MKSMEDNPAGITKADIIVGIPSYNEASLISFPTQQADKGLTKYFGDFSAVIINCDNHSPDDTRRAFMETPTITPKMYVSTDEGVQGKGTNMRNLFRKAVELSARAVVVIDADLKSVTPLWIRNLAEPLLEDYQFVAPLYVRHKYDGFITNNIAYPLTRALYGRRIRQPIGGDYGFSGQLAQSFAESETWNEKVSSYGVDIWMSTMAMKSGGAVIQSFMGRPKIHRAKDPTEELEHLFRDVVLTIFDLMCSFEGFWKDVKWSRPTAVYGFGMGDVELPPTVDVDTKRLWDAFLSGVRTNWDTYTGSHQHPEPEQVGGGGRLARRGFRIPDRSLGQGTVRFRRGLQETGDAQRRADFSPHAPLPGEDPVVRPGNAGHEYPAGRGIHRGPVLAV